MTVLNTLKFVAFNPLTNNNPIAVRRRKLIAKIDEQLKLTIDAEYTPMKTKWVTDSEGNQNKVEVAKRVKRWWSASVDGKINLVVRYGNKQLQFVKGKSAIKLSSEADVEKTLIEQQARFGRTVKNKVKATV